MRSPVTHVGFSDESNWNVGQFRSLSLVTTTIEYLDGLEGELAQIFFESDVSEFKWKELRGARERFAAEKMCTFAIKKATTRQLRVDVLIWNIQDSRHDIQGRDDIANLERMYYHLFRNVLRKRWPNNAVWRLIPDEHTAIKWETIEDCLGQVSVRPHAERSILTGGKFLVRLQREFGLQEIISGKSSDCPLLQLADLFAGLAVFSRKKVGEYQEWLNECSPQLRLFKNNTDGISSSRASKERFVVLHFFDTECKNGKLGVSLKSDCGLWTPNPSNPLNFWMYKPQHPEDKAPTRT